jgi:hypothetical protein
MLKSIKTNQHRMKVYPWNVLFLEIKSRDKIISLVEYHNTNKQPGENYGVTKDFSRKNYMRVSELFHFSCCY